MPPPTDTLEDAPPAPARAPRVPFGNPRRLLQRRRHDRLARWVVTAGGLTVIASILGILLFLVGEVVPLIEGATVEPKAEVHLPIDHPVALLSDEARSQVAFLDADGVVRVWRISDAALLAEERLCAASEVHDGGQILGAPGFYVGTTRGSVVCRTVSFETEFGAAGTLVHPRLGPAVEVPVDPEGHAPLACAASARDASTAVAAALADGSVVVAERVVEENLFSGAKTATIAQRRLRAPAPVVQLLLDGRRENLYGATKDGRLLWWDLRDRDHDDPQTAAVGAPATALLLLIGDQSLVVGQEDGSISIWYRLATQGTRPALTRVRDFPRRDAPVRRLARSERDRVFAAQDERGRLGLYYSTTGRILWSGDASFAASALEICPKRNGLLLATAGRLLPFDLDCRHPEAGWRAFFGKIWYEGYPEPEQVWQSSSGSDEAEAKFGLTPLLFGTLKATVFSMLVAVPLAILAAMATSQFMHWKLRRFVKPVVEIMASLPSVVLGFLAGLWLAPRVAQFFLGVPLFLLLAPVAVIGAGLLGEKLPRSFRHRFPDGFASIAFIAVLAVALGIAIALCRPIEVALFDGDFIAWLRTGLGITYDQKNCVVLGLAMGVAVIPIIFAIAEDAFSNVPTSLVSGSLALGADRWYTVTRVVFPTASPGLFSAVMIGFGRAVGETMIVVMASGNTPTMDWSIFNGLRSLSANIATEIPEAPEGGTLYRTLFLAALLLFTLTFAVNTAAEIVRQRLRQRYARL